MVDPTCCTRAFALPLSLATVLTSPSIKRAPGVLNYNMMEHVGIKSAPRSALNWQREDGSWFHRVSLVAAETDDRTLILGFLLNIIVRCCCQAANQNLFHITIVRWLDVLTRLLRCCSCQCLCVQSLLLFSCRLDSVFTTHDQWCRPYSVDTKLTLFTSAADACISLSCCQ